VEETALTRLASSEMRQVVGALTPPSALRRSSQGAPLTRAASAALGETTEIEMITGGLPPELTYSLRRELPPDTSTAEQWLAVDATQLARYLTLSDEVLYRAVSHHHLLSYVWKSDQEAANKAPLHRLTQRFNEVANILASALVSTASLTTRAALFGHFINVGHALSKLGSYNALMALLASLGSAAVHRLKHTKAKLHPKLIAKWEALAALMSHDGSYRSYRAALSMARRHPPFIPYLGVHLTDLTFLGDGNKDVLPDGQINLSKRQQVHTVLTSCLSGRSVRYPFASLPGLAKLLEAAPRLSEDEAYAKSLKIEPRGKPPPT